MSRYKKAIASFFIILSISFSPISSVNAIKDSISRQEQPSPVAMTVDLLICRPLGLVAMLCSTVIFVVSSPFSALGGNIDEAWDSLVVVPVDYTFIRPLGQFD